MFIGQLLRFIKMGEGTIQRELCLTEHLRNGWDMVHSLQQNKFPADRVQCSIHCAVLNCHWFPEVSSPQYEICCQEKVVTFLYLQNFQGAGKGSAMGIYMGSSKYIRNLWLQLVHFHSEPKQLNFQRN
ncbi:Hypothetical predicted protein [Podarcis lilfordi]|uniref:Uncharacterized protein n=1 Tax=Podarcis lilfordi TaxID=74358 RepID=A0AA35K8J1_9SAUR|nr:Hypothetical predicted protein [Podarcis lilfordi]